MNQIVDRHDGKRIEKAFTAGKDNRGHKTLVPFYEIKDEATGAVLNTAKTLTEARTAIGKVIEHPAPTSLKKSAYKGPAKGNATGGGNGKGRK